MTITARTYSDDRIVDIRFDAEWWFGNVGDQEIIDLAECGWGGDYPADAVAISMADHDTAVAEMFAHIERVSSPGKPVGFECHVDATEALTWLDDNKPELAARLRANENIDTTKRL
jgi:hypothetical protein